MVKVGIVYQVNWGVNCFFYMLMRCYSFTEIWTRFVDFTSFLFFYYKERKALMRMGIDLRNKLFKSFIYQRDSINLLTDINVESITGIINP